MALRKGRARAAGRPGAKAFWAANFAVAILFGLAHLTADVVLVTCARRLAS